MREVKVTVTGINNYGITTAKQQIMYSDKNKPITKVIEDAVTELAACGYMFVEILNIHLAYS